jgi:hypothetical protein
LGGYRKQFVESQLRRRHLQSEVKLTLAFPRAHRGLFRFETLDAFKQRALSGLDALARKRTKRAPDRTVSIFVAIMLSSILERRGEPIESIYQLVWTSK